jgi:hypothetical protein
MPKTCAGVCGIRESEVCGFNNGTTAKRAQKVRGKMKFGEPQEAAA